MDVMGADIGGMRFYFDHDDEAYIHTFEHGGQPFKVMLNPIERLKASSTEQSDHGGDTYEVAVDNAYGLSFKGPRGWSTTNKAGADAFGVYKKLMVAVRAFMASHDVNGLYFTPFEPGMRTVYDNFYRVYLLPDPPVGAGFVRTAPDSYISKEWMRQHSDDFHDIEDAVAAATAHTKEMIKKSRQEKADERGFRQSMSKMDGKFMIYHKLSRYIKSLVFFIKDGEGIYLSDTFELRSYTIGPRDFPNFVREATPAEVDEFAKLLAQHCGGATNSSCTLIAYMPESFRARMADLSGQAPA